MFFIGAILDNFLHDSASISQAQYIKPRTFDLLVRISADSSKMDPTKIKNHHYHFIFLLPPESRHIPGTIGPIEMVHLSIFVEFNKEYNEVFWK